MSGTFSGLSVALSALHAQRRGLDVTGQNVANANTEGYSRQRVVLDSVGAPAVPAFFAKYDGAGGGVAVSDVQRLRDAFLEGRGHTEHGLSGYLDARKDVLTSLQGVLGEPADTRLQGQLSEFWKAWADVANHPEDGAPRSQLIQRASLVADSLHTAYDVQGAQWLAYRGQVDTLAAEVNTVATSIAELNVAIRRNTQSGIPSPELADQRDLLVMGLADRGGASVQARADGAVDVYLGGSALVRGDTTEAVEVTGPSTWAQATVAPPATRPTVALVWGKDGSSTRVDRGEVAGLLEGMNEVLPRWSDRLDDFARDLATQVNDVHVAGYGSDGVMGRAFFLVRRRPPCRSRSPHPRRSPPPATPVPTSTGGGPRTWPRSAPPGRRPTRPTASWSSTSA